MTATATKKIPNIFATSTTNFYDVLSSDNKTHYPLLVEGYGQVSCGCPAGSAGKNCYHRTYALTSIAYIDEDAYNRLAQLEIDLHQWRAEMGWLETLERGEEITTLEEVEELFNEAA
jgi:hypothetical protein